MNVVNAEDTSARSSARDCNAFGFKLQKVLSVMPGNYVVCPYSLHRVLSLLEEGAEGETAKEMSGLLHLETTANRGESVKELLSSLRNSAKVSQIAFQSTNHLWYRQGVTMEQDFVSKSTASYGVIPEVLDFADGKKAGFKMNQAISTATHGRIPQLIPAGDIHSDTSLVLANTVYFKGLWQSRFETRRTKPRPFWVASDKRMREVPVMLQLTSLPYSHGDGFSLLEMPIDGMQADFSMLFLLPDDRDALPAIEKNLTLSQWDAAIKNLSTYEVTLLLPKFSFSMGGDYKSMMSALGMKSIFTAGLAQFPKISLQSPVSVSSLLHETTVEVDEMGAETAAATAVPAAPFGDAAGGSSAGNNVKRVVFKADHPFLFALRHSSSGLLLVMGRINLP